MICYRAKEDEELKPFWMMSVAALLAALAFADAASAQGTYPTKPIRMIVPFPPGGGTDILSRLVANKLTESAGWQIVVDNRGGAGGNIGLDAAAKAAPDGYTMVMGQTSNLTINPALYTKLPYDSLRDFTPVSVVASSPIAFMIHAKAPYRTFKDLIAAGKAKQRSPGWPRPRHARSGHDASRCGSGRTGNSP